MRSHQSLIYHSPEGRPVPPVVRQWAEAGGFPLAAQPDGSDVEELVLRGANVLLVLDGDTLGEGGLALLRRLKHDAFTAVVPAVVVASHHEPGQVRAWFEAGADEVVTDLFDAAEQRARFEALHARARRDVSVHPSTRMPGTTEIEREIRRRLEAGGLFAVCYADLDHFKEFNDRYSYYDGDRVIYLLSRILHDVVRGMVPGDGFVGHIGGDDFIFVVPGEAISPVCTEILSVFDTLVPFQYNEQDRRAGYFFGKDRRGQLHRVPLMTLSIGIVTNRHRRFTHPAQVSELATEMKSYAKTLPGSIFVVDRRQEADAGGERGGAARRE